MSRIFIFNFIFILISLSIIQISKAESLLVLKNTSATDFSMHRFDIETDTETLLLEFKVTLMAVCHVISTKFQIRMLEHKVMQARE